MVVGIKVPQTQGPRAPAPGARRRGGMGIGNKQEHERSDVYVACNGRMVGVQYRVALEPEHGRVQVVFCMAHSNGDAASKHFRTTFTFRSDGDSPSLDDQAAAAIARFVKRKVDKGVLLLRAALSDPMEVEVEPQDQSGECFRLRVGQQEKEGESLWWGGCSACAATACDCTSLLSPAVRRDGPCPCP